MKILMIILLVIAGFIALLFILALFMKRKHFVKREIIVDAPRQQIFDFLTLLKNQDAFNKGALADADREKTYEGTDGTVGYIYAWKGDKSAGEGEKEIMKIQEGNSIEMEIRFVKPMSVRASITMKTESVSDRQTKVSWSNSGTLRYPLNLLVPMLEKHATKDIDSSLSVLKNMMEK